MAFPPAADLMEQHQMTSGAPVSRADIERLFSDARIANPSADDVMRCQAALAGMARALRLLPDNLPWSAEPWRDAAPRVRV
jgi:hypothetical protein